MIAAYVDKTASLSAVLDARAPSSSAARALVHGSDPEAVAVVGQVDLAMPT